MDPPGHTPSDKHDTRQSPRPEQSAARTAETVAVYLAHLLWDAAVYLGESALDLIDAVRVVLLRRSATKSPERAGDFDAQMARLKAQKSRRWSSFEILSGGRRLQIRSAAMVIVVAAILGLRAYLGRGAKSELSSPEQVAYQPTPAYAPPAPVPRAAASIALPSAAPTVNQSRIDAEHFAEYRRKAAPGDWIVYGVTPVEIASAELADAEAQKKSAEAAALAADKEFDALKEEERFKGAVREMRAAEDERSAREKDYSDAQNALYHARYPEVRPVLERGEVHEWDGFKVMSPVVIKEGNRYRMWYVGCHFIGDDYTCGVGHAESIDGVTWKKSRGPVLTIEGGESQDLHSIAVVRTGDEYLMWYALDSNPLAGNDCATLSLATSRDGLAWKPNGLALKTNCQNAAHLWQSAFYDGKTIHLWYGDYDSSASGSLIHLTSVDGKKWDKAGSTDIGTLGMDPRRLWVMPDHSAGYRALFAAPDRSGYFGMLQSVDGNVWKTGGDAPKLANLFSSGDDGKPEAPAELVESAGTWMWFAVPNTRDGSEEIALAFQKEAPR
jgi:hypothetical protein